MVKIVSSVISILLLCLVSCSRACLSPTNDNCFIATAEIKFAWQNDAKNERRILEWNSDRATSSLDSQLLPSLSLSVSPLRNLWICGMNDFIDNLANNSHHSNAIFIKSLTAKSSIVRLWTRTEFLICANQFPKRAKLINLSFAFWGGHQRLNNLFSIATVISMASR